jgi:RNA polymerase sigma-70 factor (ECF subfamily)
MKRTQSCTANDLKVHTDEELVGLAQGGDSEAFGQLVLRYQSRIYRLARRMTDSPEDAEDVLQEAFVRAFNAIGRFQGRSRFSTWLYRITVNLALMKRRAKKNNIESLDEPLSTIDGEIRKDLRDTSRDPLDALVARESLEYLDKAIADLSPRNRAVFVLRHVEGLSSEETMRILKISVSALKSRLHRARLDLQARLSGFPQEEIQTACAS